MEEMEMTIDSHVRGSKRSHNNGKESDKTIGREKMNEE
jgi:hypothetical protein